MLYLAQVKINSDSGASEFQLIARQQSEHIWEICNAHLPLGDKSQAMLNACNLCEGLLLLVELDEDRQAIAIENAKDWVVNLIIEHLSKTSISPEFVRQEQQRIEQWRQEIAAQSLDLTRRYLEIETQREQIEELEASLKLEREQIELRWQQIQDLETNRDRNNNS
jgi:hypothetical protein